MTSSSRTWEQRVDAIKKCDRPPTIRRSRRREGCGRPDFDADLGLTFSDGGKKLAIAWGLDNIAEGTGTLDPSYAPHEGNENFVRFVGFTDLEGAFAEMPKRTTILVEKPLLEGKPGAREAPVSPAEQRVRAGRQRLRAEQPERAVVRRRSGRSRGGRPSDDGPRASAWCGGRASCGDRP